MDRLIPFHRKVRKNENEENKREEKFDVLCRGL